MSQTLESPPHAAAAEMVLTNAKLVLPDRVLHGSIVLRDGRIAAVDSGRSHVPGAFDLEGDTLIPGIIDLHTDNLERQVVPRSGARWPSRPAFLAHDAQCAAAGVTTVFNALCVGDLGLDDDDRVRTLRDGAADLEVLSATGLLRVDHFLHLRCELSAEGMPELLESVAGHRRARMASLMDHTPGTGQYADLSRYRARCLRGGAALPEVEARIGTLQARRDRLREPQRRLVLDRLAARPVVLASHDDETEDEVARNHADGIRISEFPVRMKAARAARVLGLQVIAGAPNLVRGGSHSGNVAVAALLQEELVDALASDYVPSSLLEAVFRLADGTMTLPGAVALVTDGPARMARFDDRGRIAPGLRADLVQVRLAQDLAAPAAVWRCGRRVA